MKFNFKKIALWVGIAIVLYLIYKGISNKLESPKGTVPVVTASGATVPAPVKFKYDASKVSRTKPFGTGTTNSQEVGYLQTWLNNWYAAGLKVDGNMGAMTTAKLIAHRPGSNPIQTTLDALDI